MLRIKLIVALTALALTGISLAAAGAFAPPRQPVPPAPPSPPAPSITARPANPSNQTSAHFAYADAQSGVGYQCQLDGGSYASCATGGITYGPLGQGSHTFKVRVSAGAKTSDATAYSWTVDTVAPSTSISYPSDGATLAASDWGASCRGAGSICGTARDANRIASVLISIQQQGSSRWWGGSAYDQTSESFRQANVERDRDATRWSYALALPSDGRYTVHVRAVDDAGNTTAAGNQATASFTIDTTPPPAPTIVSGPEGETTSRSATFAFADAEHGVRLECRRDGSRFAPCTSPASYGSLSLGAHRFEVHALDGAGNASAPIGRSWTIVKTVETAGKPFSVSGNAAGALAPGVAQPLAITVANPNAVAIEITSLTVGVAAGSSNAGCDGPSNLQVTQANISSANPLAVPAGGHVALPAGAVNAPDVLMRDLPVNQDACKGATFKFTYSGSAHS